MKSYIIFGLLSLAAVGCSHDSSSSGGGGGGGPATPSRVNEHKAAECPPDLTGKYIADQDATVSFTIRLENGTNVFNAPKSGDLPINGVPTIDRADGSSNTAICTGGQIQWAATQKDGYKSTAVLSKAGEQMTLNTKDREGRDIRLSYTRVPGTRVP